MTPCRRRRISILIAPRANAMAGAMLLNVSGQEKRMRPKPMNRALVAGLALAALVASSGCTRIRTHQGYLVDNLLVDSVQPGIDNRASVEGTLGRPTFTSQFGPEEWYYVARDMKALAFSSPRPVAQTVLRVRFDGAGAVTGVDRIGLEKVARISPEGDKTPTLGRHRSIFDDIFGNIGAVGAVPGGGAGGGESGPNGS
jgi:outer membrane protein assembly factor BamE (lipoprotein component of BamABCDE complex)